MSWTLKFWDSTVGKKVLMALTGAAGFVFVIGHMAGNMQVYLGRDQINAYAHFLHEKAGLLWVVRIALLAAVGLHVLSALQLQLIKRAARPVRYQKPGIIQATPASRTMIFTGLLLAWFLLYHLAHFTWGNAHPAFRELDAYNNIVTGFQHVPSSVFYIVCMVLLGLHLGHGGNALFFSLGLVHPKYRQAVRAITYALMLLVVIANISIPVAVLAGVLKI
ncbi:MAG: succinate dehydrogenase cytochrome b subunit [Deltaproteobacteria bacterium]|nr:succinate dehydrogenase cytochrome b subunit [Deltaproteobacteria bacterium]